MQQPAPLRLVAQTAVECALSLLLLLLLGEERSIVSGSPTSTSAYRFIACPRSGRTRRRPGDSPPRDGRSRSSTSHGSSIKPVVFPPKRDSCALASNVQASAQLRSLHCLDPSTLGLVSAKQTQSLFLFRVRVRNGVLAVHDRKTRISSSFASDGDRKGGRVVHGRPRREIRWWRGRRSSPRARCSGRRTGSRSG